MTNPYTHTKKFWFEHFKTELMFGQPHTAEEHFMRYRYWKRREKVWTYLEQLCKEKEFGNAPG